MPLTRYGDASPVFGMSSETFGLAQESTSRRMADEVTCENHVGDVVTVGYLNARTEGSVTVINSGGAAPTLFSSLSSANITATGRMTVTEVETRRENKNWQRITANFKAYDAIS